jgi:hypothetical protein
MANLTIQDFARKLAEAEYAKRGFASRAVHKMGISDAEKTKCFALVDKHFGKEPSVQKTGKKRAAKAPAKAPAKAAKTAKAEAKVDGRKRKKASAPLAAPAAVPKQRKQRAAKSRVQLGELDLLGRIHLLSGVSVSAAEAIKALDIAGKHVPGKDITRGMAEGVGTLGGTMTQLNSAIAEFSKSEEDLLAHETTVSSPPGATEAFAAIAPPFNGQQRTTP